MELSGTRAQLKLQRVVLVVFESSAQVEGASCEDVVLNDGASSDTLGLPDLVCSANDALVVDAHAVKLYGWRRLRLAEGAASLRRCSL